MHIAVDSIEEAKDAQANKDDLLQFALATICADPRLVSAAKTLHRSRPAQSMMAGTLNLNFLVDAKESSLPAEVAHPASTPSSVEGKEAAESVTTMSPIDKAALDSAANLIVDRSHGYFLAVSTALNAIASGKHTFGSLPSSGNAIESAYYQAFADLCNADPATTTAVRAIIEVVAASSRPMPTAVIMEAARIDSHSLKEEDLRAAIDLLSCFLPEFPSIGCRAFSHKSFPDWATSVGSPVKAVLSNGYKKLASLCALQLHALGVTRGTIPAGGSDDLRRRVSAWICRPLAELEPIPAQDLSDAVYLSIARSLSDESRIKFGPRSLSDMTASWTPELTFGEVSLLSLLAVDTVSAHAAAADVLRVWLLLSDLHTYLAKAAAPLSTQTDIHSLAGVPQLLLSVCRFPLHILAHIGSDAALQAVLQFAASGQSPEHALNARELERDEAWHVAARRGHADVVFRLLEHFRKPFDARIAAALARTSQWRRVLFKCDWQSEEYFFLLTDAAAEQDNADFLTLLLQRTSHDSRQTAFGQVARRAAMKCAHILLKQFDLDPFAVAAPFACSPFQVACGTSPQLADFFLAARPKACKKCGVRLASVSRFDKLCCVRVLTVT